MANADETRKHFENILGRQLDPDNDDPVVLRENIGVHTFIPVRDLPSNITSRDIGSTGEATKACANTSVVRINGTAITNEQGTIEFFVNDFICATDISYLYPANVIATPRGRRPVFLTLRHNLIGSQSNFTDIKVNVFSWDASGTAAPGIVFDWQCIVPYFVNVE